MDIINFIIHIIIKPLIIINLYLISHERILIDISVKRGESPLLKDISINTHSWKFKRDIINFTFN